jgi:hypothetical protein
LNKENSDSSFFDSFEMDTTLQMPLPMDGSDQVNAIRNKLLKTPISLCSLLMDLLADPD